MRLKKYIIGILVSTVLVSCNNFDEINTNPDSATKVTESLLATSSIMGIMKPSTSKGFIQQALLSKQLCWSEGIEDYQYNKFDREDFSGYTSLKNYSLMSELASPKDKNAYEALGLFLKAYRLYNYTISVGDIPYSEILKGSEGLLTPKYDTQKDVFNYLIKDLDKSYDLFKNAGNFSGDPILNGNVSKWSKIVTAFELRLLINLSKKEADQDLNIKAKFAEVMKRNALMASNNDNLQLVFSDKEGQLYPFHNSQNKFILYPMLSQTLIDILQSNQDYRLFYYAAPSKAKLSSGLTEDDWNAYPGIDPTLPINKIKTILSNKQHCSLNDRYMYLSKGEPFIIIGYAEQNFIIAEAAVRGWITDDASVYYKKGIEASMKFIADNTPDEKVYNHGRKITDEVITSTLSNPKIQLNGSKEENLKKVLEQKYVAGFLQLPYQTYYDYRRTGYPQLPISVETNMNNDEPTKIPVRWLYPSGEFANNKVNTEEAIKRQFNGDDDVNQLMWILK